MHHKIVPCFTLPPLNHDGQHLPWESQHQLNVLTTTMFMLGWWQWLLLMNSLLINLFYKSYLSSYVLPFTSMEVSLGQFWKMIANMYSHLGRLLYLQIFIPQPCLLDCYGVSKGDRRWDWNHSWWHLFSMQVQVEHNFSSQNQTAHKQKAVTFNIVSNYFVIT